MGRISGKITQLSDLPVSVWPQFIEGWLKRNRTDVVPCVLPKTERIVRVPLKAFYQSYSFFSETRRGRDELCFFLDQLRPGDIIYDIGAFYGVYGVAARLALADSAPVYLFEPVEQNRECIQEIARLNAFECFTIVDRAVGQNGHIKGVLDQASGMLRDGNPITGSPFQTISVSVDSYWEQSGRAPTVMKIDVEGFELEVLYGAEQCLRRSKPRLWLELHPELLRAKSCNWEDAIGIVQSAGYRTIKFYRDKALPTCDRGFHVWCAP